MTINPVQFGTDGWRAIIGETFTFENVRACAQATAAHFAETYGTSKPLNSSSPNCWSAATSIKTPTKAGTALATRLFYGTAR